MSDAFDPRIGGRRSALLPALLAGVWLVYLGQPLHQVLASPSGVWRTVGMVALGVFAAAYVTVFFQMRRRRWAAASDGSTYDPFRLDTVTGALVAMMVVCLALLFPAAGSSALAAVVYVAATVMMLTPLPVGWTVSILCVVGTETATTVVPGWSDDSGAGLAILLASVAVFGMRLALRRSQQLSAARSDLARLAVQEERNRFARDLHDILGHSLTVVTMKAELAGRLVHADPDAAEREIADVERLTREALADVRAAVAGYRGVTLAAELANARAALQAAGITAALPTAVDHVPGELRALFGWAVREGVTNVVRHSRARRCTVTVWADAVEVRDDGHGSDPEAESGAGHGHGLVGLGERARAAGGRVLAQARDDGFVLRVEVSPTAVDGRGPRGAEADRRAGEGRAHARRYGVARSGG
ncbi:MAG TPA: histidine kinase [Actinomycetales bacterium]|nr:histidine kinase [Actinomycetales bacterium]